MKQFALVELFCSHVTLTTAFSVPFSLPLRSDFWPIVTGSHLQKLHQPSLHRHHCTPITIQIKKPDPGRIGASLTLSWLHSHLIFVQFLRFFLSHSFTRNRLFSYKFVLSHLLLNNSGCCSRCNCGSLAFSRRCSSRR